MPYELPITVRDAVDRINAHKYVLPAIQREFVWRPDQIERLFDSLCKGYPLGSFLFWTVDAANIPKYDFYHFVQHYHELHAPHNPKASLAGTGDATAVLDGQQRLTSLFVGLRGSYAARRRYAWKTSANAYPVRRLYLNLTGEPDDLELEFGFAFREESSDLVEDKQGDRWFRVGKVLDMPDTWDAMQFLTDRQLNTPRAQTCMKALYRGVHQTTAISFYQEKAQELDRVLAIFVRVNSGGTVLSYSDLLLSMATASWTDLDARETIYKLVDDVNKSGQGFNFSKDFVLKTCLMVAGYETRFSTASFTADKMHVIERRWPEIEQAVRTTVALLASFGLSAETLPSVNAVVPIVDYLVARQAPVGYATAAAFAADRERVRRWLAVALLKRTFTGQPDSILRIARDAIRAHGAAGFPAVEIVRALRGTVRPMDVSADDLDRMLDETYGSAYAFATLGLLYPPVAAGHTFHVDHLHPQVGFAPKRLDKAGVTNPDLREHYVARRDTIPNLQLLPGAANVAKSGKAFDTWLAAQYAGDPAGEATYRALHFIPDVDAGFGSFLAFTDARRALMRARLAQVIGAGARP